jgi:competence protein ComEC
MTSSSPRRALPLIAVAFCSATALRLCVPVPVEVWAVIAALCLLVGFVFGSRPTAVTIAVAGLFFAAGGWRADAWNRLPTDSVAHLAGYRWTRLHGYVYAVQTTGGLSSVDVRAEQAETRRESRTATGRIRVYLPEGVAVPEYGSAIAVEGRVRLPDDAGNPGELPPGRYLRRDNIVAVMRADTISLEEGRREYALIALALRSKRHLERGIAATSTNPSTGLLRGLLFSETAALPERDQTAFRRSGVVHVLSTSGLHVAVLAQILALFWRAKSLKARKTRALVLVLSTIFFTLMTGLRPAVVRAALVVGLAYSAPLFRREADIWCALSAAALALVAVSPANLIDPGFQLSFSAAVCLALWYRRVAVSASGIIPRFERWAGHLLSGSLVASLATSVLSGLYFGSLSLSAPVTNLLVIPAVAPAMLLGLIQGALWPWAPLVARTVGGVNAWFTEWILAVVRFISGFRWSALDVWTIPVWFVVIWQIALLAVLWANRFARGREVVRRAWPPATAVIFASLLWTSTAPRPLQVVFLDVGQGDSILIRTPSRKTVLVDTGGTYRGEESGGYRASSDVGRRVLVPALSRAGVKKVDALIITHPHEDHAGGAPEVIRRFPVALFWDPGGTDTESPGYAATLQEIKKRRIPKQEPSHGDRLELDSGVTITALRPEPGPGTDVNNSSLILRLTYGDTAFLLAGDAEVKEEDRLLATGADIRADLLKVGHHASAAACGSRFLRAVGPESAVISVGLNNGFGHPDRATLQRLSAAGAEVYRTDRDGGVLVTSDGKRLRVRTSRWEVP